MSLHCAATLLIRHPADAVDDVAALRDRRIAEVYAVLPADDQVQTICAELGLTARPVTLADGDGLAFVHANESALQGISDLHRGETVLVLVTDAYRIRAIEIEMGDDGVAVR